MDNTALNWTHYKWISHLREVLNYPRIRNDLRDLLRWTSELHSTVQTHSVATIRNKITFFWDFWLTLLKAVSPKLFDFLERERYFLQGKKFIISINRLENPTLLQVLEIHQRYPFEQFLYSLDISLEATIIILSQDIHQSDWVSSLFVHDHIARDIALKLVRSIQPFSRFFLRKNTGRP